MYTAVITTNGNATRGMRHASRNVGYTARKVSIGMRFCSPSVIEICGAPDRGSYGGRDLIVIGAPRSAPISFNRGKGGIALDDHLVRIRIGPRANNVRFFSSSNRHLLASGSCKARFAPFGSTNIPSFGIHRTFLLSGSRMVCNLKRRRANGIGRHGRGLFLHGRGVDVYVPFVRSIGKCTLC